MTDLVAAAEAVSELVSANADEAEQLRRLPQKTVDALVQAELMRMAVPAAYGGPEADPLTMLTAIETVDFFASAGRDRVCRSPSRSASVSDFASASTS